MRALINTWVHLAGVKAAALVVEQSSSRAVEMGIGTSGGSELAQAMENEEPPPPPPLLGAWGKIARPPSWQASKQRGDCKLTSTGLRERYNFGSVRKHDVCRRQSAKTKLYSDSLY